jgi:BioD-like phosphotransacetylase family protein
LLNRQTPRVFVAATRQDEGKTTIALGLFHALKRRLREIGYIKPVGQRCIDVNGLSIDEDSVLMERTYGIRVPIEAMSPLAIGKQFTRKFLASDATEGPLVERLHRAFDRAAWEKDFVIVEGSGHAGVGSVFGLSNARVAQILDCPAIIVTRGGIGDPVDDVSLSLALFEKHRARVIGVIFNKVLPDKIDVVRDFAGRALKRMGVELLGILPADPLLAQPSVSLIAHEIGAAFLSGHASARRRIADLQFWIGPHDQPRPKKPDTLLVHVGPASGASSLVAKIVAGGASAHAACILFCDGETPPPEITAQLDQLGIPCLATAASPHDAAEAVRRITVKTAPDDEDKIHIIQRLVENHVDIDRMLRHCRRPG